MLFITHARVCVHKLHQMGKLRSKKGPSFDISISDAPADLVSFGNLMEEEFLMTTVVARSFRTPRVFPMNPVVNKSCKIEPFGNKMHKIIQNMTLSQDLEFKLSLW